MIASGAFTRAIVLRPTSGPRARGKTARTTRPRGRSDEALVIFLRAYAYSGDPRPLLRIATFEYVTGHYPDARAHATRTKLLLRDQPSKLRYETDALIKAVARECNKFKDPVRCVGD